MKSVQDTIYNWLTIKVVCDARPDDTAAHETKQIFDELLAEKQVSDIKIETDEDMYYIHYMVEGDAKKTRFPRELIEVMLDQINSEPEKFVNYPNN